MSANANRNRRDTDASLLRIEQLIQAENDPKMRALLIAMQCIAIEVAYACSQLFETKTKMEEQEQIVENHAKIVDRALLMWRWAVWLSMSIPIGIASFGTYVFTNIETLKRDVAVLMSTQSPVEHRHGEDKDGKA